MSKLLSTYFDLHADVELPDGTRRGYAESAHRICTREQLTDPEYGKNLARHLYAKIGESARVRRITLIKALAPGGESIDLGQIIVPDHDKRRIA